MATKRIRRASKGAKARELTLDLEFLDGRLAGGQKVGGQSSRKDAWLVYRSGDLSSHYASVVENLTGNITKVDALPFQFGRATVKEGLPREAFDRIKRALATTTEELSSITVIPVRTIARRKKFKADESDRIFRVASAFQKTIELFEDLDKARRWFTTPKSALAGISPMECCDTELGCKEVENLLGRIDETVYS